MGKTPFRRGGPPDQDCRAPEPRPWSSRRRARVIGDVGTISFTISLPPSVSETAGSAGSLGGTEGRAPRKTRARTIAPPGMLAAGGPRPGPGPPGQPRCGLAMRCSIQTSRACPWRRAADRRSTTSIAAPCGWSAPRPARMRQAPRFGVASGPRKEEITRPSPPAPPWQDVNELEDWARMPRPTSGIPPTQSSNRVGHFLRTRDPLTTSAQRGGWSSLPSATLRSPRPRRFRHRSRPEDPRSNAVDPSARRSDA